MHLALDEVNKNDEDDDFFIRCYNLNTLSQPIVVHVDIICILITISYSSRSVDEERNSYF